MAGLHGHHFAADQYKRREFCFRRPPMPFVGLSNISIQSRRRKSRLGQNRDRLVPVVIEYWLKTCQRGQLRSRGDAEDADKVLQTCHLRE